MVIKLEQYFILPTFFFHSPNNNRISSQQAYHNHRTIDDKNVSINALCFRDPEGTQVLNNSATAHAEHLTNPYTNIFRE